MKTKTELLEEKLAANEYIIGTQCDIPNLRVLDMVTTTDYDVIWIDTEHHPINSESLHDMLMLLSYKKSAAIVRIVENNPAVVKPILDMGADGIIFPNVRSAEEARLCVASATYPPEGIRGFAPGRGALKYGAITTEEYIAHAAKKIWKIIQLEDYRVLDCLDDILAVPGIDMLLIGPWDMSGSMGVLNQTDHPELKKVFDAIMEKANAAGMPVAICCTPAQVPEWLARGVKALWIGGDTGFIAGGAAGHYKSLLEMCRDYQESQKEG